MMKERLLNAALMRNNSGRPPVWFMRQAGRYHDHYQRIRAKHSFIDVCKNPEIATEATMGPIEDFDFDAAILFSDILFPLESMGVPLDYNPGPQLGFLLREQADFAKLRKADVSTLAFQREAIDGIRARLSEEKALIGFVGAPLTLFYFAVEGSHKQDLTSARAGLKDGRFEAFSELMLPLLAENMKLQARGKVDAMAMFDTCAGDLDPTTYRDVAVPGIRQVLEVLRADHPDTKIIYYSKGTTAEHWEALRDLPIDCLGVDWHHDLGDVLKRYGEHWSIQGNFDPNWLRDCDREDLTSKLNRYFDKILALPSDCLKGWVCGLGHGVLPNTPEENVRLFLKIQAEAFGGR